VGVVAVVALVEPRPRPASRRAPEVAAARQVSRSEQPVRPRGEGVGRVAVVIDDMGDSIETAGSVLALEPAVTVAVMPFRAASARVAAAAVERGREVIMHLPLEPERRSEMADAPGFLLTSMEPSRLEQQLDADLATVPYIVGVNGHMGSRFTSDRFAMERLLLALRARGLFFLDSFTSPGSVAAATAERIGVPFVQRSVFLDHDPEPAAVATQLARVERLARDGRDVVAIGHPRPATLAALAPWMPRLATSRIRAVPLSALVH
jgi:polysaccharide deacetylase 2 family uncharacterized protein YibQ